VIRVDTGEEFPIVITLIDETTGMPGTGETVYYEIRGADDSFLSPPCSGIAPESAVEAGVYRTTATINSPGEYVIYGTCTGFVTSAEDLLVNPESVYDLTKAFNVSVEDVPRTNAGATPSQIARNVPMNKTDYIVHRIKKDTDPDWSGTVTSGIIYAWYRNITDELPYKMAGNGL
jgi:hypothetical protein